jgi:single-strand DNA-binding protein
MSPAQKWAGNTKKETKMSMQVNQVQFVANLTKDPELCHTSDGVAVIEVPFAVNERYKSNGKEQKLTTFIDVQVWSKAAENLAKIAEKGDELFITGSLRQSLWKDKDTDKGRSKIFIRADSWQFTQHKGPEKAPEQEMER